MHDHPPSSRAARDPHPLPTTRPVIRNLAKVRTRQCGAREQEPGRYEIVPAALRSGYVIVIVFARNGRCHLIEPPYNMPSFVAYPALYTSRSSNTPRMCILGAATRSQLVNVVNSIASGVERGQGACGSRTLPRRARRRRDVPGTTTA